MGAYECCSGIDSGSRKEILHIKGLKVSLTVVLYGASFRTASHLMLVND